MGRIKTTVIKRKTKGILSKYNERFSTDFSGNKLALAKCTSIASKKLRNVVAGYLSRLKNKEA